MNIETIERRKYKIVFCVLDCATGKPVAGRMPVESEDAWQLMAELPPAGFERVPEERRESWIADNCSAAGDMVGKKIASILKSLVLGK